MRSGRVESGRGTGFRDAAVVWEAFGIFIFYLFFPFPDGKGGASIFFFF